MFAGAAHRHAAAGGLKLHRLGDFQEGAINGILDDARDMKTRCDKESRHDVICIFIISRRCFDPQLIPIGIKLVRQHRPKGRKHALPHFGMRHDRGYAIVAVDFDPGVDEDFIPRGYKRLQLWDAVPRPDANPDEQRAACDDTCGDDAAPRPLVHVKDSRRPIVCPQSRPA